MKSQTAESLSDGIGFAGLCIAVAIAFFALARCEQSSEAQRQTTERLRIQLQSEGKLKQ